MEIVSLLVEKGDKNMLLYQDNKGGTFLHNVISVYTQIQFLNICYSREGKIWLCWRMVTVILPLAIC